MGTKLIHIKLIALLILMSGCSTAPIFEAGDNQALNLNDEVKFKVLHSGKPGVELILPKSVQSCRKISEKPKIKLKGDYIETLEVQTHCVNGWKRLFASFDTSVPPGEYEVEISDLGSIDDELFGYILHVPDEKEQNSGADQVYQGAIALAEGVNQGKLSQAGSDSSDWWSVSSESFSRFQFFFSHDSDSKNLKLKLYRLTNGKLQLRKLIRYKKNTVIGLEGNYFLKVSSIPWAKTAQYSISMKNLGASSPKPSGMLSKIGIIEVWSIEEKKSAILLEAGSNAEIKQGDSVKIFQSGRFLDACVIVGIGQNESECHISKSLQSRDGLSARRQL